MFNRSLNHKFKYTLKGKTYTPTAQEFRLIYDSKVDSTYWNTKQGAYKKYKNELKKAHYFGQKMRCAYCRKRLRADGYWEDLDHIVAQSKKGNWIYYPKNLIVTCLPCNRLKNADPTLSNQNAKRFPLHSLGFRIFNPHFDNWEDHFVIEKGIFLKGIPQTKGPDTYNFCNLHRMDIIIDYADEQRIWNVKTMRRLTHRLRTVTKGSNEEKSINEAIIHMIRRKKQN
ncbi:MAG: HNH endonuclease [Crocinitomicaceae bacterium]|nr:HNH endonuclease [Crocinitomicaceae bacterium]